MPRNSSLSSTVASLLLEAEATADPIALNSAQDEAKVALKRLRTVNAASSPTSNMCVLSSVLDAAVRV